LGGKPENVLLLGNKPENILILGKKPEITLILTRVLLPAKKGYQAKIPSSKF
jgi:hypothetical protein